MNKCPDCKGNLEKGTLMDYTIGGILAQRYAKADVPDKPSDIYGKFAIKETNFQNIRRVNAFRCEDCDRIFLYAHKSIDVTSVSEGTRRALPTVLFLVTITLLGSLIFAFLLTSFVNVNR